MRSILGVLPVVLFAGMAIAQGDGGPNPVDPRAIVPPVDFRSAFEGYRPFADQELRDWRKSNDEVGAAGGHAGNRPGQLPGAQGDKLPPGQPEGHGSRGGPK